MVLRNLSVAVATSIAVIFNAPSAQPRPQLERISAQAHAAGASQQYQSANWGCLETGSAVYLIDVPRATEVEKFLGEVRKLTSKPIRGLLLTRLQPGDEKIVQQMLAMGVPSVVASPPVRRRLLAAGTGIGPLRVREQSAGPVDGPGSPVMISLDAYQPEGAAAFYAPSQRVLFGGPSVINGPRAELKGHNTERWIEALKTLETMSVSVVVPGRGSWGGAELIIRQRQYLSELRRQMGHLIAQGRPFPDLIKSVLIPAPFQVWMPYDNPTDEDLAHVYEEMTVPRAPFEGQPPMRAGSDAQPSQRRALVLFGDGPHEPGHIEDALRRAFAGSNVQPYFTVDVRALSAENLQRVHLLVVLRDGLQRPATGPNSDYVWMTPQQEQAVVKFVQEGGGFLNLHNSMGLYPDNGPYLNLVGGRYRGHGPLERFRVEVTDPNHPLAQGVQDFTVADEQHTPDCDRSRVKVFLGSRSQEGTVADAGWSYEPGRGRLCHLAPGHTRESLMHPMMQRLIKNAIRWCAKQ